MTRERGRGSGVKARRQELILRMIQERPVETQSELAAELRERGVEVTQATVSRDVKELRLAKVATGDGGYRYALPPDSGPVRAAVNLRRVQHAFREDVVQIDWADNLVVVKTLPGTAPSVAAAIDEVSVEHVVATLAGDDVVLAIVRPGARRPVGTVGEVLRQFEAWRKPQSTRR